MNTKTENNRNENQPRQHDKDSVDTYKDLTKLIITLSTGTFVLSPAFLGLLKLKSVKFLGYLWASWALLLISIILGLFVLSSLAGTQHKNEYNIDNLITKFLSIPQWLGFVLGILFFAIFLIKNLL